jgi:hypothetical protein
MCHKLQSDHKKAEQAACAGSFDNGLEKQPVHDQNLSLITIVHRIKTDFLFLIDTSAIVN